MIDRIYLGKFAMKKNVKTLDGNAYSFRIASIAIITNIARKLNAKGFVMRSGAKDGVIIRKKIRDSLPEKLSGFRSPDRKRSKINLHVPPRKRTPRSVVQEVILSPIILSPGCHAT